MRGSKTSPAREDQFTNLVWSEAKWQLGGREADGVTVFARHDGCLPASERSGACSLPLLPASAPLHGESELVKRAVNFRAPEWFYAHALERKARRP